MSYRHEDAKDNETTDFNAKTTPDRQSFVPDVDPYPRRLDAEETDVKKEMTRTGRDFIREMQDGQKNPENPGKLKGALRL